jgi:hypothetical protein
VRAWHFGQHTHREDLIIKVINDITGKNFLSRGGTRRGRRPRGGELARGHVGKGNTIEGTRGQGERQDTDAAIQLNLSYTGAR